MELRTQDSYQKFIFDFLQSNVFVVCPKCSNKAIVKTEGFSFKNAENNIRLICTDCGHNKKLAERPSTIIYAASGKLIQGKDLVIGRPIDPFFHLDLWLTNDCQENQLWAYNYDHLNFLHGHVEAKLRERNGQELVNQSLGSRLPRWMTSKKNREVVLKRIAELQDK